MFITDAMQRYTLGDLESLTGIKTDTIRIWESRYGILTPGRTQTNRRFYSDDDLIHLINISMLYRKGIKISRIASMPSGDIATRAAEIAAESFAPDTVIDSLVIAMIRLDESAVNEILLNSVIRVGFEETFTRVVFPFLHRVGVMWHTGMVNVGAEHFISNVFRNRLISATDGITAIRSDDKKRIVMFLPEDEYHELGLLYYRYIVRKKGHEVLYLGQSTPFDSLREVCSQWNPDILITGILSGWAYSSPEEYLKTLGSAFSSKKILVAGMLGDVALTLDLPNVFVLISEADLNKYL